MTRRHIIDCTRMQGKSVRLDTDLVGMKFGRLTAQSRITDPISCGCYRQDNGRAIKTKHGDFGSPEYRSWNHLKARCFDPNDISFKNYGGRGITVCEEWRNDYAAFLRDMGRKPSEKHSIDRIDTNGDYTPGNCRWATPKTQGRNTRCTRMSIESAYEVKILARAGVKPREIAERFGVCTKTIRCIVAGSQWAPE